MKQRGKTETQNKANARRNEIGKEKKYPETTIWKVEDF